MILGKIHKTTDIVAELRAWQKAGTDSVIGRAADEIERLREELDEARLERDSARKMYCSEMAHDGTSPADVADALGWDITRKEANV